MYFVEKHGDKPWGLGGRFSTLRPQLQVEIHHFRWPEGHPRLSSHYSGWYIYEPNIGKKYTYRLTQTRVQFLAKDSSVEFASKTMWRWESWQFYMWKQCWSSLWIAFTSQNVSERTCRQSYPLGPSSLGRCWKYVHAWNPSQVLPQIGATMKTIGFSSFR